MVIVKFEESMSLMPKAIWNGTVLAESDRTQVVENNHYFPPDTINKEYFQESNTHTTCPWKGVASYYSIEVDGQVNKDAAWYYPTAKDKAKNIEGYVAFWKGVKVEADWLARAEYFIPAMRPHPSQVFQHLREWLENWVVFPNQVRDGVEWFSIQTAFYDWLVRLS